MTKEEIFTKGYFSRTDLFSQFFGKNVKVLALNVLSAESEAEMSLIVAIVNELLSFDQQNEAWLKREIWKHYQSCISNISYSGVSLQGFNNEVEAKKFHFNIFTEEEAYKSVQLEKIWFDASFIDFRYYNLEFKCPWETEHGIKIGVRNGEFDSIE